MARLIDYLFSRVLLSFVIRKAFLVSLLVLIPFFQAQPQGRPETKLRAKLDVVLMFDSSGSMLKTDPSELRYEGAKLLFSFLGEGDRLGIVQFSGDAKVVRDLEPFNPSTGEALSSQIRAIHAEGAFTDLTEGVKVSLQLLEKAPKIDAQRVIIVLSDGRVEPDPKVGPAFARTLQLVQEVLPDLKSKEIKVFTLALSEQADRALLGEVSTATDGLSWYTQSAEDVHRSFEALFLALKRPQVVPQTARGFSIDADVSEATFYINHSPDAVLSLISPKEEVLTAEKHPEFVTWFVGKNFDVITVIEPDLGDWRVAGSVTDDGFATVLTDLKLLSDWPLVVRAGDEPVVQARLYEDNKPVVLPEMSGVVKFGFQIVPTDKVSKPVVQEALSDDGHRGDVIAQDGIFSSRSGPLEVGSYKLTVVAKGPTFQRSQQIPFTVRPRLISLSMTGPGAAFAERGAEPTPDSLNYSGGEETEFRVSISKEAAALKDLKVTLLALSEQREVVDLPLNRMSTTGRDYSANASGLKVSGRYKVKAVLKGSDKKGVPIEAESQIAQLEFTATPGVKSEDSEKEHSEDHKHEEGKQGASHFRLPVLSILALSLLNLGAFFLVRRYFGRAKRSRGAEGQRYMPPTQMLESLEVLEARAGLVSVEPDDPVFKLVEGLSRDLPSEDLSLEQTEPKA